MPRLRVFALGIPLDRNGPQSGTRQRFNPIHTMFRDGGDAPKTPDEVRAMEGYGGSDDWIVMPLQCERRVITVVPLADLATGSAGALGLRQAVRRRP